MPKFPYFGFPGFYYRNYNYAPSYNKFHTNANKFKNTQHQSSINHNYKKIENEPKTVLPDGTFVFDLFGLKLYFDDILLICLIFFLYNEGVKDEGLFFSLILLLLT